MSSPRTAERLTRILSMLPWVIANPGATIEEVCKRFGYSRDDLMKDLNLVFVCGLPGYGPGDLMEAFVDEDEVIVDMADYFARPVRLTATEALMLLASGLAVMSSGAAPPALESAVAKLQQVVVPDEGAVEVDLAAEPDTLDLFRRAAAAGEVVAITYTAIGSGETTDRDIEPWAVSATLGNWYVTGHCRLAGAERVFRIDRIRAARPTGERFSPPDVPPAPEIRYTPGVDDVTVRLDLAPEATWVADYYPVSVVSEENGRKVIDFSSGDTATPARLVLRLGGAGSIVEGSEVAEAARDLRRRILERYG
ncbi:MAG TPA: WYL domain-containing protein [Acidimicrobiia bacterium]|nr:WYL domain-containing protein [Acidimicrobiia bacterium]